ncbi:hypothetical protein [Nocardioides conyzicola]|uniref:Tissue inhibitor of metalloproteinase n=1 Tax=Nocardioides conyzicola TaxID=1651781 RepID=A0ABP8XDN9_9ACTN
MRRFLAALLLACSTVVALAAPSLAACPAGAPSGLQERTMAADDIFTGVVSDRSVTGNTATYTVDVQRIYKGTLVGEQVSVSTDTRSRACGLPRLEKGSSYVFFTQADGSDLTSDQRSGTSSATDAYVARVESLLGEGQPAVPPTPEQATFTTVADPPADVQRLAAPGAALVIVGLLGLVFVAWRGRRRA